MTNCTIIGLGEAGAIYASALVRAGHNVTGYDPVAPSTPDGVIRAESAAAACADADIVLVFTGASVARVVAEECLPALKDGACYADFTSSSPQTMEELGNLPSKGSFADVAIMGPVLVKETQTPLMASGPGAQAVSDLLTPLGADVEVVEGPPGAAMSHKLLRSIVMKGIASVVVEAVTAGKAAGLESWIRDQIAAQLAGDGHKVVDRFLTGTQKHAKRRMQEMKDTAQYLSGLGVPAEMTEASASALDRMAAQSTPALSR
jgi:3-hydroxyisobutyrate dehydrogenase-like beta-hydroxyacid dehydrogenase